MTLVETVLCVGFGLALACQTQADQTALVTATSQFYSQPPRVIIKRCDCQWTANSTGYRTPTPAPRTPIPGRRTPIPAPRTPTPVRRDYAHV